LQDRAVSESLRAQRRSILEFLEASIRARRNDASGPSLLPTRSLAINA
jgi:hypothetical protein